MSKFKNLDKIYVIGTGLSSLISVLFLVSKGIKPIVIDIATEYNFSNYKVPIFKPYYYKKKIEEVSFFGGLSNIWKGVIKFASKEDFKELNINNPEELIEEMMSYMDNLYFFSNVEIKKNKFELQRISNKNEIINNMLKKFNEIHQPIIMSSQKEFCNPYNTSELVRSLIKKDKITFIKGKVLSVKTNKDNNLIEFISNNKKYVQEYEYIFCGAGVISSTNIITQSLNLHTKPELKSSQKWLFLSFYKKKKIINNTFPLYQGVITDNNKTNIYIQSNLLSQLTKSKFHGLLKITTDFIFKLPIFNYISISYVSTLKKNKKNNRVSNLYSYFKELIVISKKINNFQNLFKILPVGLKLPNLAGGHFGSTFPYSKNKNLPLKIENKIISDEYGSIKNIKNLSIIDMTTFSKIHVVPPTLNLMLHSLNITKKVFNDKMSKPN